MQQKFTQLIVEMLEDRNLLSVWGMAWPNAGRLTASFVPDGTMVDGLPSTMFQSLGSQASTWQLEVLRALQTWAVHANINIGLVSDGGQALGTDGVLQGDARFGDIRLAARPMGLDPLSEQHLAIGTPYTPLAGTQAGDVVFNSAQPIASGGVYDLFTVALHEAGHVFGFADENIDPTSANYYGYLGPRTDLSDADIGMLQSLYGARSGDGYEGLTGNDSFAAATPILLPNIAGDITSLNDADFYRFTVPAHAGSSITVTVQTAGLSLLAPRLSVFDADAQLVSTATAVSSFNGDVTITLDNVMHGDVYYFKVESGAGDVFGIGGYRLKVDSGAVAQSEIAALDAMLDGSVATAVASGATLSAATPLDQPAYATTTGSNYEVLATLDSAGAQQFFSVMTPEATGSAAPQALLVTVTAGQGSALDAKVTVYDADGQPVSAQVLSNDGSSFVVQIVKPVAGASYYVAVSANAAATADHATGTYLLSASFRDSAIVLDALVDGTLTDTSNVSVHNLQSTEFQLYHFVLSVDAGASADVVVQFNLYDENNNVVLSLNCQNGETISANVALNKATYAAHVVATNLSGMPLPSVSFQLQGTDLSDPMDPIPVNPNDPTLPPPTVAPPSIIVTDPAVTTAPPVAPTSPPTTPPPTYPTATADATTAPSTTTTTTADATTAPSTTITTTTTTSTTTTTAVPTAPPPPTGV